MKRKLISFLLMICIVVSSTGLIALANGEPKINLAEELGKISISVDGADYYGGELVIGFYSDTEDICGIKTYKAYDGMTYTLNAPDNAATVKVMWLKSFKSLKPVCDASSIKIEKPNIIETDINNIEAYDMDIATKGYIEYYKSFDAVNTSNIYIARENNTEVLDIYVNGLKQYNEFEITYLTYKDFDSTIKFTDYDKDEYYEKAEFTVYDHFVIEEVDPADDTIIFKDAGRVVFTDILEDPDYTIEFKDKNGNNIEIADFKANDVVAVIAENPGTRAYKPRPSNYCVTYINLGDNTIEGQIDVLNSTENYVNINGVKYYTHSHITLGATEGFSLGDKGTYLLTLSGKIFMCSKIHYNIAYILDAAVNSSALATTLQFKLLTSDGDIIIKDAHTKFSYTLSNGMHINNADIEYLSDQITHIYNRNGTASGEDRLVKYTFSSSDCLRSIEAFDSNETMSFSNGRWDSDLITIDGNELSEDAKIFAIDSNDLNNSFATSITALKEENSYSGFVTNFSNFDFSYSAAVLDAEDVGEIEKEPDTDTDTDTDEDVTSAYPYAYILDCAVNENGIEGPSLMFKLLTPDTGIITANANSRFTYTLADGTGENKADIQTYAYEIAEIYRRNGTATKADRLITYTLNANKLILHIEAFEDACNIANGIFDSDASMISGNLIDETAKIFAVDESNVDTSYVTSASALNETISYNGILAGFDDTISAYSLAVFNAYDMRRIDMSQGMAIVNGVSSVLCEGEEAIEVIIYKDNSLEPVTLLFNDDSYTNSGYYDMDDINVGSVILYNANEKGLVSNYLVLGVIRNNTLLINYDAVTMAEGTDANSIDYEYAYGYINSIRNNIVTLTNGMAYKASGNMYTYENKSAGASITVGDYLAGYVDNYDYETNTANFVFMKLANDKVTDIYTIGTRTTLPDASEDAGGIW